MWKRSLLSKLIAFHLLKANCETVDIMGIKLGLRVLDGREMTTDWKINVVAPILKEKEIQSAAHLTEG